MNTFQNGSIQSFPDRQIGRSPTLIAHQGDQNSQAANSYQAIISAIGTAEAIEFDIYNIPISNDSSLTETIIMHPEGYFLHVNKAGMKNHEQLPINWDELQKINRNGSRLVPTLDEILDLYPKLVQEKGCRTELHIELKGPNTANAAVSKLQDRIAKNQLTYKDLIVCAFCYENEEVSRLEQVRKLDPNIRLCLFIRGGDFSLDAFKNYAEVFDYAKKLNIELVNITRRNLTPSIVEQIRSNGFKVGCHHARTSDEFESALALGVDSVQADMFLGPDLNSYQRVNRNNSELFPGIYEDLYQLGFYKLRDYIWEIGWHSEKIKDTSIEVKKTKYSDSSVKVDAAIRLSQNGTTILKLFPTNKLVDFTNIEIPKDYLGQCDQIVLGGNAKISYGDFFQASFQTQLFCNLLNGLRARFNTGLSTDFVKNISDKAILAISEGDYSLVRKIVPDISSRDLQLLKQISNQIFVRVGRVIGMLAFTALCPRHINQDNFSIGIDFADFSYTPTIYSAALEQITAQLARSAKRANVRVL